MTDKQPNAATAKIFDLAADAFQPLPSDDWIWSTAKSCRGRDPTPEYLQGFIAAVRSRPGQAETELWNDRQTLAAFAAGYERAVLDGYETLRIAVEERTEQALAAIEAHAKAIIDAHVEKIEGGTPAISNKPTLN
ncbi:hypothetical protein EHE22_03670 [Ochrobactrum pseudogrignonense]|uniref:Uncharacterized protein n=1 Tax=Brucella pseudogrignonensis TaxID=419475 RepID=A0A7Y3WVW5_9HYPH|nr:hypothetical protein [Brucella pseudogrignonensis]NNV19528.1 hypothetical protein [Brucella pseudogrignonensis]